MALRNVEAELIELAEVVGGTDALHKMLDKIFVGNPTLKLTRGRETLAYVYITGSNKKGAMALLAQSVLGKWYVLRGSVLNKASADAPSLSRLRPDIAKSIERIRARSGQDATGHCVLICDEELTGFSNPMLAAWQICLGTTGGHRWTLVHNHERVGTLATPFVPQLAATTVSKAEKPSAKAKKIKPASTAVCVDDDEVSDDEPVVAQAPKKANKKAAAAKTDDEPFDTSKLIKAIVEADDAEEIDSETTDDGNGDDDNSDDA